MKKNLGILSNISWKKLLIVAVFIFVSFQTLTSFKQASYDLDELYAHDYAQEISVSNLPHLVDKDSGNPPLYFILLRVWLFVAADEFSARFLSFIFFSASFVLFVQIGRQLHLNQEKRTAASILFLGMYYKIPIITYLRPYALLSLLILLTVYLSFAVQQKTARSSWMLPLVIVVGFFTHYLYWFFYGFWLLAWGVVGLFKKNRQEVFRVVRFLALGAICVAPLVFHLILREVTASGLYEFGYQLSFSWPGFTSWLYRFAKFSFANHIPEIMSAGLWIVFLALVFKRALSETRTQRKGLLVFTGALWGAYLFSPLHDLLSYEKYLDFITPFVIISFLFVAEPVFIIANQKPWFRKQKKIVSNGVLVLLLAWICGASSTSFFKTIPMDESWRNAVREAERADLPIVTDCANFPGLRYYLQRDAQLFAFSENGCGLPVLHAGRESVVYVAEFELNAAAYEQEYSLDHLSESGYVKIGFLKSRHGIVPEKRHFY